MMRQRRNFFLMTDYFGLKFQSYVFVHCQITKISFVLEGAKKIISGGIQEDANQKMMA